MQEELVEPKKDEQDDKYIILKSGKFDYFTEGFELPPKQQAIRNRILTQAPTLKTKTYRESMIKIVSSLADLDSFSDNLEHKVDKLLQSQETTFVESYKQHIVTIQTEFDKLHGCIRELEDKIRYYENQGKMSELVKKVHHLQQESSRLFKVVAGKERKIKDLQLTVAMLTKQMKILQETVKVNIRQKSHYFSKEVNETEESPYKLEDLTVFPTQFSKKGSYISPIEHLGHSSAKNIDKTSSLKSVTVDIQHHDLFSNQLSKNKQSSIREEMLSKQNYKLKIKNKKLVRHQTRIVDTQGEVEDFFVSCVEELKRQIRVRKKMEVCTFEDFKKEDKLMLMIKVLSNNEILAYLHERIFHNKRKNSIICNLTPEQKSEGGLQKRLPKIKFNLSYQQK